MRVRRRVKRWGELVIRGLSEPVKVDLKLMPELERWKWHYLPSMKKVRGMVEGKRVLLQNYIPRLMGREWEGTHFLSGDKLDMRFANLKPYDAVFDKRNKGAGVTRKIFLGKVRWQASISYRGRMIYLGLYKTMEGASKAFARAKRAIMMRRKQ